MKYVVTLMVFLIYVVAAVLYTRATFEQVQCTAQKPEPQKVQIYPYSDN